MKVEVNSYFFIGIAFSNKILFKHQRIDPYHYRKYKYVFMLSFNWLYISDELDNSLI
jgi:hypothetical protein